MLTKDKEDCLSINVKLEKEIIELIYADFECSLRDVESYEGSYIKNIKITFLVVWLKKLFALMIGLLS